MIWTHAERVEALQATYADFRRTTALGRASTPVWSSVALHRPAEFNKSHIPAFLAGEEPGAYICVYPFVRSYEWYLLPDEERRRMLAEHGMAAREYKDVRANTVPAFALGDYEWLLAFEAPELHRIVDLMRELRATDARRHTREETPFFTGPRVAGRAAGEFAALTDGEDMTAQFDPTDPTRFEEMYRDERVAHGLPAATPWDIGGPQPVVQQLVALGAIKGEVLDPGTGPGHHAIYYASQGLFGDRNRRLGSRGYERARENARKAGVSVNFQLADATKLDGLDNRFDTVVDCAFYHTFSTEPELQRSYAQALHRATKPGARLYMFEFGIGNVNGFKMLRSLSEDDFRTVFPDAGWEITYLGRPPTRSTSARRFDRMRQRNPEHGRADGAGGRTVPDYGAVADQRPGARAVLGSARHAGGLGARPSPSGAPDAVE